MSLDLVNQRFGKLIAIEPTNKRVDKKIIWRCFCDCGNEWFVSSAHLKSGHTKSCGCLKKETSFVHGMHGTPEYRIWDAIVQRCENPKNTAYKSYGGRGIKVCERWHKFENFYADVGDRPEGLTFDRKDNDGDYEPTNWRWATRSEQQRNRRPVFWGIAKQRWFFAFNLNTGEWFEDDNQHEFARKHELSVAMVCHCLHKRRKTHKNWIFEYLL